MNHKSLVLLINASLFIFFQHSELSTISILNTLKPTSKRDSARREMSPNINGVLGEEKEVNPVFKTQPGHSELKQKIVYTNVFALLYFHVAALYGLYLCYASARWGTILFNVIMYVIGGLGLTAGCHRLWSHRSYKANRPLQIILMLFNCVAAQTSILNWARGHRLHHKHSDTDADPHNASRGLFYSHIGWVMLKSHPATIEKGKLIDVSDLTSNSIVMFQNKYVVILFASFNYILPTLVPFLLWNETLTNSWHINMLRFVFNLHFTFIINSVTHHWGYRPYNGQILPSQNISLFIPTLGESSHNYHHAFPWDYRSAEHGNGAINITKAFIDFFALIGWAYDRKTASVDTITSTMVQKGDGSDIWGNYDTKKSKLEVRKKLLNK